VQDLHVSEVPLWEISRFGVSPGVKHRLLREEEAFASAASMKIGQKPIDHGLYFHDKWSWRGPSPPGMKMSAGVGAIHESPLQVIRHLSLVTRHAFSR
jgi:hypothetical protein